MVAGSKAAYLTAKTWFPPTSKLTQAKAKIPGANLIARYFYTSFMNLEYLDPAVRNLYHLFP